MSPSVLLNTGARVILKKCNLYQVIYLLQILQGLPISFTIKINILTVVCKLPILAILLSYYPLLHCPHPKTTLAVFWIIHETHSYYRDFPLPVKLFTQISTYLKFLVPPNVVFSIKLMLATPFKKSKILLILFTLFFIL